MTYARFFLHQRVQSHRLYCPRYVTRCYFTITITPTVPFTISDVEWVENGQNTPTVSDGPAYLTTEKYNILLIYVAHQIHKHSLNTTLS